MENKIIELEKQLQRKKVQNDKLSDIIRKRNEQIKNLNYTLFEYRDLTPDTAKANLKISKLERKYSSMKGRYKYELDKFKQALTRIKKISEHCINKDICTFCDYSDRCYIEDEEIPTYDVCKLILEIVNEVIE